MKPLHRILTGVLLIIPALMLLVLVLLGRAAEWLLEQLINIPSASTLRDLNGAWANRNHH